MADTFSYMIGKGISLPIAAVGISVTPNNTAFANSNWFEVVASAATDYYVAGMVLETIGLGTRDVEVDVGVGAAGSEAVVTTFRFHCNTTPYKSYQPHVILGDYIASGSRIALRMRKSSTGTTAFVYGLEVVEKPFTGNILTTTKPQKVYPPAAAPVTLPAGAGSWLNGAWTQITSSTAAAVVISGLVTNASSAGSEWEIDIGKGGAGAETVIHTVRGRSSAGGLSGSTDQCYNFHNPLDNVPASTRIACRLRTTAGNNTAALTYFEKPL